MSADVTIICIRLNDYAQVATVASILFALLYISVHSFVFGFSGFFVAVDVIIPQMRSSSIISFFRFFPSLWMRFIKRYTTTIKSIKTLNELSGFFFIFRKMCSFLQNYWTIQSPWWWRPYDYMRFLKEDSVHFRCDLWMLIKVFGLKCSFTQHN